MRLVLLFAIGLLLAPAPAQAEVDCDQAVRAMLATARTFNALVAERVPEDSQAFSLARHDAAYAIGIYYGWCSSWISEKSWQSKVTPGTDAIIAKQEPTKVQAPPH